MNITVFCSSQTRLGEPAYQEGMRLGRLIASAGHTVLTGGYIGSMEAVSRGAAEAGGWVVGITCDEIEAYRPGKANQWIHEERRFASIRQRLFALIDGCDAAMALPGGIGTLSEVSMMWSHLQTGVISPRRLVLIGSGWYETIHTFCQVFDAHVPERHRALLAFASDVDAALTMI